MGLPVEKRRFTIQEYLALEEKAVDKHEFHDGEILAMSGGTIEQSTIIINIGSELRSRLKGKSCRPLDSNIRVRIPGLARYMYPDISVICGPPEFDPDDKKRTTIINPRVIIEVLSDSTEAYDRGEKFSLYRELESLEEYVLVSQRNAQVETYVRQKDATWLFTAWTGLKASVKLQALQIELPLSEIYLDVAFQPAPPKLELDPTQP